MTLVLRALNPQTEQHLFETAYNWRKSPRRDRVAFEVFAADDSRQIVFGLFVENELHAVYVFYEVGPNLFDSHFTSNRKADKSLVFAGARQLVDWFSANNIVLVAYISERAIPLRRFVEMVGFVPFQKIVLHPDTDGGTVPATTQLWVEYRSKVTPSFESFKQETADARHDG